MKPILGALLAAFALVASASAATEWKTDFEAAKIQAAKEKKLVLLDFTGSDWCGFCIRMKRDTLDQPAFREYAAKNLVLVEVDFPQKKKLSAAQKKANDALQSKFAVDGFPTYVVTDATGKELARQSGYLKGGPSAFIDLLDGAKAMTK